ncbi:9371_t:CDS:2 [Cetraspora pellucida]|uniref:9371_t:CDS:1 n=1 Tax=Cetraspora pellucida TaxID=1433469 RepID=A0A9N9DLK8_9GLOM|nr:9371_t:CDS:2 [Cetraspora pellucida]
MLFCKPIQNKDQDPKAGPAPVIQDQDSEAGLGLAIQIYREEQTIIQSNINQKKFTIEKHFRLIYKKEESAIPKPVIASKNYNRQHIIYLIALTDITKFELEKSLIYYQEHCFSLEKATQRVTLPIKDVNDFEKFKNYNQMINALCVIITDFKADNQKCNKKYEGQMRKLAKQKANSFCYLVYWFDTEDIWRPFLYQEENAT